MTIAKVAKKIRRSQEERSATTRDALIRAAVDCICDIGYAGTTTSLIAKRANVTRGAVQHHFRSRDDLIHAVIDFVHLKLNFGIDTRKLRDAPLRVRIDAVIDNYRKVFSDKPFLADLNIWLGVGAEPELYAKLKALLASIQQQIRANWEEVFHDIDIPPEQLQSIRRIVMSSVRGYRIQEIFGTSASWERDALELREMAYSRFESFPMKQEKPTPAPKAKRLAKAGAISKRSESIAG